MVSLGQVMLRCVRLSYGRIGCVRLGRWTKVMSSKVRLWNVILGQVELSNVTVRLC